MRMNESLGYWTADEVAECLDVGMELYGKLWKLTNNSINRKPLGGEEPIIADTYSNNMKQLWNQFTEEEQRVMNDAYRGCYG